MSSRRYEVRYYDGSVVRDLPSYADAIARVIHVYPDAAFGPVGDLTDGSSRTLCWETEEEAERDDGARAIATIIREEMP